MFDGLTPTHLILVLAIALIVFGPGKLPEVGSAIGRGIREFRSAVQGKDDALPLAATGPAPATGTSPEQDGPSTSS